MEQVDFIQREARVLPLLVSGGNLETCGRTTTDEYQDGIGGYCVKISKTEDTRAYFNIEYQISPRTLGHQLPFVRK